MGDEPIVMQPKMYLLTGLSFSGKSTLAWAISEALNIPIVDPDKVAQEQGIGLKGEDVSDAQWALIHKESERRAAWLLKSGSSLVYDTTAFNQHQREDLRGMAAHCGAEMQLVFVSISREEARRRWERNNKTLPRFVVAEEDFNRVAEHFEPPGDGEAHLVYEAGQDLVQWVGLSIRR